MSRPRLGCFPGSFDPPTVAHLLIADAAAEQCGLDVVELVVSAASLGKDPTRMTEASLRADALAALLSRRTDRRVRLTDAQLLVEIAEGCDVLVLGADKWHQIQQVHWYRGDPAARDAALAALPTVALIPRPPLPTPDPTDRVVIIDVPAWVGEVSSTAVRAGRLDWRAMPS